MRVRGRQATGAPCAIQRWVIVAQSEHKHTDLKSDMGRIRHILRPDLRVAPNKRHWFWIRHSSSWAMESRQYDERIRDHEHGAA